LLAGPLLAFAAGAPALAGLAPGDHEIALAHGGFARSYLVHLPPQAAAGRPLPVVLNFHGGGANASLQKWYSRMDEAADRHGFIAVYPNGTGPVPGRFLTWNTGACCGWAALQGVDDVGFAVQVLEDLARRTALDRARAYATGLSNGSMMAYRLAADRPERIAAVAGVAGAAHPASGSSLPVPVLHIHSADDARALYRGGLGPPFPASATRVFHPPVEETVQAWARRNGCPEHPRLVEFRTGAPRAGEARHTAERYLYSPCREGAEVVLWKLTGAGHVWPGGRQGYLPLLLGAGTTVLDANEEIWAFFSRFRRAPP
jgi:polyhydroxybutyrate depolymerase